MPLTYDHEALLKIRESITPNREEYALSVQLSRVSVFRIESGESVRRTTLDKYLSGLGLHYEQIALNHDVSTYSSPSIDFPAAIDFRPYTPPREDSEVWKNEVVAVSLLNFTIQGGRSGSIVEDVEIEISLPIQKKYFRPIRLKWHRWVSLSNGALADPSIMSPSSVWRGEINRFETGSQPSAFQLEPGERVSYELMFKPVGQSISWHSFTRFFHDIISYEENDGLNFKLLVRWKQMWGSPILEKNFSVPVRCLNTGCEKMSSGKWGMARMLSLITLEGGEDACGLECCNWHMDR